MKMKDWSLEVFVNENLYYRCKDVRDEGRPWTSLELPLGKTISSIQFHCPPVVNARKGGVLVLENYGAYNFLIEARSVPGGMSILQNLLFMGKRNHVDLVDVIKLNLHSKSISHSEEVFGFEWEGGPVSGWKDGTLSSDHSYKLLAYV